jgi:hypothetical protein
MSRVEIHDTYLTSSSHLPFLYFSTEEEEQVEQEKESVEEDEEYGK